MCRFPFGINRQIHEKSSYTDRWQVSLSILLSIGWWCMVTGQSVVLYSRLNLVIGNSCKLRWTLGMILSVFTCVQVPTTVFFLAANCGINAVEARFDAVYQAFEKTQLTVITAQESLLSGLYVYEAMHGFKSMLAFKRARVQKTIRELIGVFVLVIALDITLLVLEYSNNYLIQTTWKPVVYSVKLKAETMVLNNLIDLVQSRTCICQGTPEVSISNHPCLSKRREKEKPFRVAFRARLHQTDQLYPLATSRLCFRLPSI